MHLKKKIEELASKEPKVDLKALKDLHNNIGKCMNIITGEKTKVLILHTCWVR